MSSNDEGLDKSALLLMALGADEAAEVLKQLGPKEVQKLGAAMAAMPAQSREKLEEIGATMSKNDYGRYLLQMAKEDRE